MPLRWRLVLLIAVVCWGAVRSAAAAEPPRIVFFGDSLTAGLHASQPDLTYRALLLRAMAGEAAPPSAIAFIQDPVGLLDDAQSKLPLVLAARPALVFLELGHHEVWTDDAQVDLFEERYRDILDRLLRSGADVVPSTLAWLGFPPGSFEYRAAERINGIIRHLAGERGLVVADLWSVTDRRVELLSTAHDASFIEPYTGDDLHPNDAGHETLAGAFLRAYREWLRRQAHAAAQPV